MKEPNNVGQLLIAITAMAAVIVWLTVKGTKYIRTLHQKHEENMERVLRESWTRAEQMISAVNNQAQSNSEVAHAVKNNTATIVDLRKYILRDLRSGTGGKGRRKGG